ncbi:helix-turn-helix domain-containing protein [Agrobacterium larrymoorei]|uniref:GlxA family transcriptional regulator n=1 Tax=Agrobacterium larrymoorei TaxID=160699 RepID=UPI0015742C80|nr:helix-turn-helix domain-containing protein [Agrobacterium larrymoorei]NTJ45324.1 helix-turn-helix domain-containing protein [Agrobacterium larrymoorei]
MHKVSVLAIDGLIPFDLSIPCEVLGRATTASGSPAYDVKICGETPAIRTSRFNILPDHALKDLSDAHTVIIPGIVDVDREVSSPVLEAINESWQAGARIASICTGAFVLAASGLLTGRRATTHWRGAEELQMRYPDIMVDPSVLWVDEGRLITSAGASAGIDMCLHLVRKDFGQAVAAHAARMAVAPLDRDGGQAQFIRHTPPTSNASLAHLLDWMRANAHRPVDLDELASQACISPRTLTRRFKEQTGTTPMQWLLRTRIQLACDLLETSDAYIDEISLATGFESSVTFRARFGSIVGISPTVYRQRFNSNVAS